jgi:hypothetical protein
LALAGASLLLAAAGDWVHADGDTSASECRCVDDPLADLFANDEQCRPRPQAKLSKVYPVQQPAARRRGVSPLLTTLFNVHSRELLPVFRDTPPTAVVLGEFFRCRGFATRAQLDPRLIETVLLAAAKFESVRVRVISAYRSPKFNDALAKKGRGVASESRHTRGEAIDFGLENVKAKELGTWLWDHFEGGVGTYEEDGFVHIDVGPKRRWSGK